MSSYLSNLLTQTTSRYNSLRRTLLSSEDDGDTEDDTHICRVLRAYYHENNRALPAWLPPDPNDRKSVPPPVQQQPSGYFTSAGGGTRSQYGQHLQSQPAGGQRSSLSDLWDAPSTSPQSLRAGGRRPMASAAPSQQQQLSTLAVPQARPMPSQRAGSYQTVGSYQSTGSYQTAGSYQSASAMSSPQRDGGAASGGTAQDRLKARLWGGRQQSQGGSSSNPYDQPQQPSYSGGGGGDGRRNGQYGGSYQGNNPYDQGGGRRF